MTEALTITTWWTRYCGGIRVCTGVAAWLLLHRGLCHSSISSLLVFYLLVSQFCSDCCYFCWFCCCYCFHTTHHQSCAAKVRHLMHCTAASTTFWPVWENVGTVALERRGGGVRVFWVGKDRETNFGSCVCKQTQSNLPITESLKGDKQKEAGGWSEINPEKPQYQETDKGGSDTGL